MHTPPSRTLLALAVPLALALALSACSDSSEPVMPADPPAAAQPAATEPMAVEYAADHRIDERIEKSDVNTRLSLVGVPVYLRDKDLIEFQVEVFNDGEVALVSAGSAPVRLAITLAGPEGVDRAPGTRSFHRAQLPLIAPGDSAVVTARAPAAPIDGLMVQVELVQEGIAWWGKSYGQPTLDIGRFQRCDGAASSLCDADRVPLESR